MLDLDEWDELLTNNYTAPFHTHSNSSSQSYGISSSSNSIHDDDGIEHSHISDSDLDTHPLTLHNNSVSNHSILMIPPTSTRPRLSRLISGLSESDDTSYEHPGTHDAFPSTHDGQLSDEQRNENANVSSEIIHTVTPTDTLPRLALRYGVPIAALRRANHLWPTDPIHLRTELVIPRDGVPLPKLKSTSIPQSHHSTHGSTITHTSSRPNVPPPHHPIAITSSFNLFDSIRAAFPARMSLDSMSSRTSLSEDADGSHEMNNFGSRHHVRRGSVRRRRRHRSRDDDLLDLSSDQDVDTDLDTSVNGDGGAFSGPAGPVPKHYLGHALQHADDEARGKSPFGFNSDIEHSSGNARSLRTSGKRSSRVLDIRSPGLRIDPQPYTTNTRSQTQSETLANPISPIRTSQLAPEPAMLFPVHRTQR